jgi:uncharacterized protein
MSGDRDELRRLVEELPDERLSAVLAEARRQVHPQRSPGTWPPSWFGAIEGDRTDLGRNHEDLLADGFGRDWMIVCDPGPIVAAALRRDADSSAWQVLVPATVVAEAGYLLAKLGGPEIEAAFLDSCAEDVLSPVDLEPQDYARMSELVRQYRDFPLGTTDASVIAIAERLGIHEIATLDTRHFRAVRPRHVGTFTLLP